MITSSEIIVASVSRYVSDEVHIFGKLTDNPTVVLSFVPVDVNGVRNNLVDATILTLTGPAYSYFYNNWNSEQSLYQSVLDLIKNKTSGLVLSGFDFTKAGVDTLVVTTSPEV